MTSTVTPQSRQRLSDLLADTTLVVLLAGLPLAVVYANRSAQTVLGLVLVLAILTCIIQLSLQSDTAHRTAASFIALPPLWVNAFLAGLAYAAVTAMWSVDPATSLQRTTKLLGIVALALLLWRFMPPLAKPWHPRVAPWAIGIAAAIAAIELMGDGILRQVFYSRNPSDMNRTVVTLSLLMWPAMAIAAEHAGRRMLIAAAGLLVVVAAAVFVSQSVSAQLGLVTAFTAFLIALASVRLAIGLLSIASATAFAALPFLVIWLFGALHSALSAFPVRTQPEVRLEIWHQFARAIFEKPILGWGLESTRFFGEQDLALVAPGFVWESHGWHHPHNLVIQVWLELGAVGALLLGVAVVLACLSIRELPMKRQPYACAFFAGAFTIAVVSHGAWQTWWLALLAAGIVMFTLEDRIGAETARGNEAPAS